MDEKWPEERAYVTSRTDLKGLIDYLYLERGKKKNLEDKNSEFWGRDKKYG